MRFRVWYGPGRDHDYGEEMDFEQFCNGDLFSVEAMDAVAALAVDEMYHDVEIEPGPGSDEPRKFSVRRVS